MPRYKLTIEYDGGPFVGWQAQTNGPSVQGALEAAAETLCGAPVTTRAAGRTDAGVHALGQVVDLDLPKEYPAETVRDALNFHLRPAPVAILAAQAVAEHFSARFDAVARHYRYLIVNRRAPLALDAGRVWHVGTPLDADAMATAAAVLVGRHDFTTFRASECQAKSPVRSVDRLAVTRAGERVVIDVSARSFLHSQVRSFVGSLKLVGEGKWSAADLAAALEARDRAACGPLAPPQGLYLVRVDYP